MDKGIMSKFAFSIKSENKLRGVHPDLQKLCHSVMAITPIDFAILHGVRTQQEQKALWDIGRLPGDTRKKVTWTLKSKHLIQSDGYGHAVDIGAYLNGVYLNGDEPKEVKYYLELSDIFKQKIKELGLNIFWGPDAGIKGDIGHYQIGR